MTSLDPFVQPSGMHFHGQSPGCSPGFSIPWWPLCLSSLHILLKHGRSCPLLLVPRPGNPKTSLLYVLPQLLTADIFIYQLEPKGGMFPEAMCRLSRVCWGNIISIHNTSSYSQVLESPQERLCDCWWHTYSKECLPKLIGTHKLPIHLKYKAWKQ